MPLFDKYVPTFRHRITRKTELHSDTSRNWLERPFSSFELWTDLHWSHSWPCRSSLDYFCRNAVRLSSWTICESIWNRWSTSNRWFSHFTPERKMHASAKFKGRAQKELRPRLLIQAMQTHKWHCVNDGRANSCPRISSIVILLSMG